MWKRRFGRRGGPPCLPCPPKGYRNGANGYFVKPMEFDDLVELVRVVVRYWEMAELPD